MGFAKTEAGRQEIEARTRRLPTALRSILLMVDGQRTDAELRAVIEGVRAPPDALEQLRDMGLIADSWSVITGKPVLPAAAATPAAPVAMPPAAAAAATADTPTSAVVEPVPDAAQEYRRLHERMSGAVGRYLGLKGYFLQLKIERCSDLQALQELLPDLEAALRKARGAAFATQWMEESGQTVSS